MYIFRLLNNIKVINEKILEVKYFLILFLRMKFIIFIFL